MTTKSKWDSLPNEILDRIVINIENENPVKTNWMIVNKQWFQWYLSVKYRSIIIYFNKKNLLKSSFLLQNIIYSKFQPGVYVKSITFKKKLTLASIKQQDLSKLFFSSFVTGASDIGIIYLLMTKCPNVKYVKFPSSIMDHTNWIHFLTALKTCDTWKLHSLSDDHYTIREHDDRCNKSYFSCLYHLRHNLKEITVTYWMMNSGSYKLLEHFKQLGKVIIGKNVLYDMKDLCNLVDHLADVVDDITVDFSDATSFEATSSKTLIASDPSMIGVFGSALATITGNKDITVATYPNVRKLTLNNFPADLLTAAEFQLIKRFSNVRQLDLTTSAHKRRNSDNHVATFLQCPDFNHILSSVESYHISYDVKQDEALYFLKDYFSILKEVMKKPSLNKISNKAGSNQQQCHLYIRSIPVRVCPSDLHTTMNIQINRRVIGINYSDRVEISLNFYIPVTKSFNAEKTVKLLLSHKNSVIEELHYRLHQQEDIGHLLKEYTVVSNSAYYSCTKINFTGGILTCDNSITNTTTQQQQVKTAITPLDNITHISFNSSRINLKALSNLSRYLPVLKVIEFSNCRFGEERGIGSFDSPFEWTIHTNPCFSLPNSNIGTLIISTSKNNPDSLIAKNNTLFIKITSFDGQDHSKGYICDSSNSRKQLKKESTITETNEETITNLMDMMTNNKVDGCSFIKVETKSIQSLLVNLNRKEDDGENHAWQQRHNTQQFNIRIPFSSST